MAQWRQHGRYFKTCALEHTIKPTVPETVLDETCHENRPEISVEQLGSFIDTFASRCAAEYDLDDQFFHHIVVAFKATFQKPDTGVPSYSKAEFQTIIDTLGKKLANALPKE